MTPNQAFNDLVSNSFRGDTEIQRVSCHQLFSYAAASVAVISRQMYHLRAIS
jgi:hypothetical protein